MKGLARLLLLLSTVGSIWLIASSGSAENLRQQDAELAVLTVNDLKTRFGGQTQSLYCVPYVLCALPNVPCPSTCNTIGQLCKTPGGQFIDEKVYDSPEDCTTTASSKLCTVQTETSVLCYKWRHCECVPDGIGGGMCEAQGNPEDECRNRLTDRDGCYYTFCQ